jgi:hypothetical protein
MGHPMDITTALENLFSESAQWQTGSENSLPKTKLSSEQFDNYVLRLWIVMAETYGHKWTSPMGETPNETWVSQLKSLSAEEWVAGITKLKASHEEWPPSLPAFMSWCTGVLSEAEAKQQAIAEWDARPPKKYNSFGNADTYESLERDRRNFIQSRVAAAAQVASDRAHGIEYRPSVDPLRICPDEEYR